MKEFVKMNKDQLELNELAFNFKKENFGRIVELIDPALKAELGKGHHRQKGLSFDDILQNARMDLYNILTEGGFDPAVSSFKTFAIKILKNKAYDEDRKNCRFTALKEKFKLKKKHEETNVADPTVEKVIFGEYLKRWDELKANLDPKTRKILMDLQKHPLVDVKKMNNLDHLQYFRWRRSLISELESSVFGSSRT